VAITLFETFRAVFYAPFYAAHALQAYREEGVDVRLETATDPAATASGLLSGEADVSWGGPMRILLTYDREPNCGLVAFCEVVTRDPFFLVGRRPRPDFQVTDLAGLRIGTVSEVPTPWMCLQDDVRRAGLDQATLDRVTDRTMAENAAALRAGDRDVVQLFQPFAEDLAGTGAGHIWYAAASRGPTSYTTLYTTKNNLAARRPTFLAMTRALQRTQNWVHASDPATIAETIAVYFPDLDPDTLTACIGRYKALGIWGRNPILPKAGFERLKAACLSGGLIERGTDFENCVDNSLAEAVAE